MNLDVVSTLKGDVEASCAVGHGFPCRRVMFVDAHDAHHAPKSLRHSARRYLQPRTSLARLRSAVRRAERLNIRKARAMSMLMSRAANWPSICVRGRRPAFHFLIGDHP